MTSGPFAELLLRHRMAAGLGQRELAGRAGLSERAVRDLERGTATRPRRHSVRALANALDLTGAELAAFASAAAGAADVDGVRSVPLPLPAPDGLVGRGEDLRALADLVLGGRHRIVTVTGPGGVGKSRLAAELVAALRRRSALDVYAVDCSALADHRLVGEIIAEAFGCGGASRLSPAQRVAAELRGRRALLVLDGFERLVAAAPEVAALVARCPGLTVLTTSQRVLRVRGEHHVRLRPLALAAAVDLFGRRAAESTPGFAVTDDNAAAVAAICRAVDRLPLALELAAARMRLVTPPELAARLDRPLRELTGGARDLPDRHRSLRAAIESSLGVVGAEARRLFAWLAAIPAGVRLGDLQPVVERVSADPDRLLDAVAELVDTNLLRVRREDAASRYVLPDTMREMAGELLAADPDEATVWRAVATQYLDRLRAAALRGGAGYADLDPDVDNLRAALAWAGSHGPELVCSETVDALYHYYELRGRFAEGRTTLAALAEAGVPGRAWALLRAARCAQFVGGLDEASRMVALAQRSLTPVDHSGHTTAHMLLGTAAVLRGDYTAAITHNEAAVRAARAAGDQRTVGQALHNLAGAHVMADDLATGERLMREALAVKQSSGAGDDDIGRTLMNLAEISLSHGDWPAAADFGTRAAALLELGGHVRLRTNALSVLAVARLAGGGGGDLDDAGSAIDQALALLEGVGDDQQLRGVVLARQSLVDHARARRTTVPDTLATAFTALQRGRLDHEIPPIVEGHAALAADRRPAVAARLLGIAQALRDRHGNRHPSLIQPAAHTEKHCRDVLGGARFERESRQDARLSDGDLVPAVIALLTTACAPT